ncbi:hypothetical protein COT65_01170 [Candidatus Shapirobacteria bacterium CG09_land_8_20_14_0_10_47_13]|uniref:Cell division protein FtsX n=1 Tax=Candidatus Shapirobacteria bacterium CG09_land_8_20_14_0_10_47_13 TaxID=1974481 RepID=A0A2H0WQ20_9BACT|nr:MAG: hypothetical protein COT65_01170 [Candidatus Shapirobacteria bacterium CG09_land_8_20_14_0_10_47_13]
MKKHLKTAWVHIRRAPYQALAAILVMVLANFAATTFILATFASQTALRWFETRPQVTAFFKDDATTAQIDALRAKLAQTGKVKETRFISKDQALTLYREQNKNDPLLLEMVTANILPASLEVSAHDLTNLAEIAQVLKNEPGVEEVVFQEDVVKALHNWVNNLRKIGVGLICVLGLISLLIILVIIGMKIALRKGEVEIIQLIGGAAWYIRAPFIFEGIFYGVIGAILGWGAGYLLLLYLTPFLVDFLAGIPVLPIPVLLMLEILGVEILAGAMIGILGSLLAVKKYLR